MIMKSSMIAMFAGNFPHDWSFGRITISPTTNNRHLAIAKGMSLLKENDILMILGKGHEDYQIIGTEKIHFSDQEEVEKYIREHIHD